MDCIKMACLISKGIMHLQSLGSNFLAMQMQCDHQTPPHWAHLWTSIIQTAWKYFHHLYSLGWKARIYWCDACYKFCLHNLVLTSKQYLTNALWQHILFHQWFLLDIIYPPVFNRYSLRECESHLFINSHVYCRVGCHLYSRVVRLVSPKCGSEAGRASN